MGTPSADNLSLGQGHLFFDRFDMSGAVPVPTGPRHLGNCSEFSLSIANEKIEKMTSMYATRRLYKQVIRQTKAQGKIKVDEYDPANVALSIMGKSAFYTRGVVTKTGANGVIMLSPAFQDRWLGLPDRWITPGSVIVKDNVGATVYVVNTDYTVDAVSGRIYIVPGGAIVAGLTLKIEYTGLAITAADKRLVLSGGTDTNIHGKLIFVGDPTVGPTYYAEFWDVMLTPDGDLGLITSDFQSFGLSFLCMNKKAQHPTEPYYKILQVK